MKPGRTVPSCRTTCKQEDESEIRASSPQCRPLEFPGVIAYPEKVSTFFAVLTGRSVHGSPFSQVDLRLLKKYDRPGPRYTSYPTAPLSVILLRTEISAGRSSTQTGRIFRGYLPLFSFSFLRHALLFSALHNGRFPRPEANRRVQHFLKKEIALVAPMLAEDRRVVQVHWGGGTPTHLLPEEIREMGEIIRTSFRLDPSAEMSVELDPRELLRDDLLALRDAGFNRMSMGVQDFDPACRRR